MRWRLAREKLTVECSRNKTYKRNKRSVGSRVGLKEQLQCNSMTAKAASDPLGHSAEGGRAELSLDHPLD